MLIQVFDAGIVQKVARGWMGERWGQVLRRACAAQDLTLNFSYFRSARPILRMIAIRQAFLLVGTAATLLSGSATIATGQSVTNDTNSPGAVVKRFGEALIAKDWAVCASLINPAELARNRAMFAPIFQRDSSGQLSRRILGVSRDSVLRVLEDQEFNARLNAFFVDMASRGSALDRFQGIDILGVTTQEKDHAFVVYRWRLPQGERPLRGAMANELHRVNGRWYLDMLADFESLRDLLARE